MNNHLILRFRAEDRPGIVARVTSLIAGRGCDVRSAEVYGDDDTGNFFCRMELTTPIEIVGVVSNHETMRKTVEWHGLPYHYLPMSDGKVAQEARFLELIRETGAELTVLARYMQILSDEFSRALEGRCINIHHSFLPSFKGAKPYHQAHARGVKIIGATAHFVTADLDEGPIIEQDVRRVSHAITADEMVAIGREIEASVLSRAVRWQAEYRIFPNGNKTVVL